MAGYIIDMTTKQVEYERMERNAKLTSSANPELVLSWLNQIEQENCLVECTKHNCKFHKKHCQIIKQLEDISEEKSIKEILEEMFDCNGTKCFLVNKIKDDYNTIK